MANSEKNEAFKVADLFFTAMESCDLETVRKVFSDDIVVWHNTDDTYKSHAEALGPIEWAFSFLDNIRYSDIRRIQIKGGFIQQHVMTAVQQHDGRKVTLPAVVICTVCDGKISRLEEYFDSAQAPTGVPVTG